MRTVFGLLLVGMGLAACSSSVGEGSTTEAIENTTTSVAPVVTTTMVSSTTSTTVDQPDDGLPSTYREAFDLMLGDVSGLTPDQVRTAGLLIGRHVPGLPFPSLYLNGDEAMQEAVTDVFTQPDWWNAQILVAMTEYDPDAAGLEATRDEVLVAVHGQDGASLAHQLMLMLIEREYDESLPGQPYDIPEVIGELEGQFTGSSFEGVVWFGGDTGEKHDSPLIAQRTASGNWELIEGPWEDIP